MSNWKGKHTEIITITHGGKKSTAILSGVPDKCEHDSDGEEMFFNDAGRYWKRSQLPKGKANAIKFMDKHRINGSCVSCSKCGKPFEPDFYAMP